MRKWKYSLIIVLAMAMIASVAYAASSGPDDLPFDEGEETEGEVTDVQGEEVLPGDVEEPQTEIVDPDEVILLGEEIDLTETNPSGDTSELPFDVQDTEVVDIDRSVEGTELDEDEGDFDIQDTKRINWTIPGGSRSNGTTEVYKLAGSTVSWNLVWTPSANVDIGVLGSNGTFYYLSDSGTSSKRTMRIPTAQRYKFAIRNKSSSTIHVSGLRDL